MFVGVFSEEAAVWIEQLLVPCPPGQGTGDVQGQSWQHRGVTEPWEGQFFPARMIFRHRDKPHSISAVQWQPGRGEHNKVQKPEIKLNPEIEMELFSIIGL